MSNLSGQIGKYAKEKVTELENQVRRRAVIITVMHATRIIHRVITAVIITIAIITVRHNDRSYIWRRIYQNKTDGKDRLGAVGIQGAGEVPQKLLWYNFS